MFDSKIFGSKLCVAEFDALILIENVSVLCNNVYHNIAFKDRCVQMGGGGGG